VFDSGVGGLSVLKHLIELMPAEKFVYLGDSARVPYGNKSPETVRLFARQCAQFLLKKGVKLIVVACNTASAVALDAIQEIADVPVIGMIEPAAAAAVRTTRTGRVGVIGTRATVESDAYGRQIREVTRLSWSKNGHAGQTLSVHSHACPLFVPIVEEGWTEHLATRLIAEEYLAPLRQIQVDTLVLGCTHYPLLKPLLQELLQDVTLIDCGEHAAVVARDILAADGMLATGKPSHNGSGPAQFYVTDVPTTFASVAERFLGFPVTRVERVQVDHLQPTLL
jgi:glutamate racemase